ncbi:hypothetical protein [Wukongibacter baidiensis]
MIFIGLTGIFGTIMWFVKSIRKPDRTNIKSSYKGKTAMSYTNRRTGSDINEQITLDNNSNFLEFNFSNEESTVLLDEFEQRSVIEETVLLEDDEEY